MSKKSVRLFLVYGGEKELAAKLTDLFLGYPKKKLVIIVIAS